jgi:hypothetical protein
MVNRASRYASRGRSMRHDLYCYCYDREHDYGAVNLLHGGFAGDTLIIVVRSSITWKSITVATTIVAISAATERTTTRTVATVLFSENE